MNMSSILKSLRIRQWTKNIVIFIGIAYSGNALDWLYLQYSLQVFLAFCLVSSAVYLANDIIDRKRDRLHPQKKYRPIASGKLSPELASGIALGLAVVSLYISSRLSDAWIAISLYLILQLTIEFAKL